MKYLFKLGVLAALCGGCLDTTADTSKFDYERLIHLDAELLCELGIEDAYLSVSKKLNEWVVPEGIKKVETNTDDYIVEIGGERYPIYIHAQQPTVTDCWENATNVFFHIVNKQLANANVKFFAFYFGNDLHGGFLNENDLNLLKTENSNNEYEWPYLPLYSSNAGTKK